MEVLIPVAEQPDIERASVDQLKPLPGRAILEIDLKPPNRKGLIPSAQLERSFGSAALDADAMTLTKRAEHAARCPTKFTAMPLVLTLPSRLNLGRHRSLRHRQDRP